jgi:FtsP/CotA-like multicopper oxidase with cupredoxin domain
MDQRAALLWYHDHVMGTTKFDVYAGLAGLWIVRDERERELDLPDAVRGAAADSGPQLRPRRARPAERPASPQDRPRRDGGLSRRSRS